MKKIMPYLVGTFILPAMVLAQDAPFNKGGWIEEDLAREAGILTTSTGEPSQIAFVLAVILVAYIVKCLVDKYA